VASHDKLDDDKRRLADEAELEWAIVRAVTPLA
jgi:hypothetical protein